MYQLNSAKDEARAKEEEGEQVEQEEERDERTSEEEVLSSFDFASCTEYSTPLPLLKYENVTATATTPATTTTSTSTLTPGAAIPAQLTREVECVQRNGSYICILLEVIFSNGSFFTEPDLIHQSRGLKGGC